MGCIECRIIENERIVNGKIAQIVLSAFFLLQSFKVIYFCHTILHASPAKFSL